MNQCFATRWMSLVALALAALLAACDDTAEEAPADARVSDLGVGPVDAAADLGPAETADAERPDAELPDAERPGAEPPDAEPADAELPLVEAFTFAGAEPAPCPLSEQDCADDWPVAGEVALLRSTERFGDVEHPRTAWLYRPPGVDGPLPLLIFLHGGNGNGAAMFARRFDELARGEEVEWRQGDADCVFTYPTGFRDADGQRCIAPRRSYRAAEPFAVLLPDGIRSMSTRIPNARHWEDGRTPSPGQLVEAETRDDVGYVAHLIETLVEQGEADAQRIYLGGWSNGGMMTQRVVCEMGRPGREPLGHIAAVAVGVAALPANLYDGTADRPRCPSDGFEPPAMLFQEGRGIDTPDCEDYPCEAPVADGDGVMPYGAPGERHRVFSPDGGFVQSFEDTRDRFHAALDAAYGADGPAELDAIGEFTSRAVTVYGGGAELRTLVTEGGAHQVGGARAEFASEGRQWQFLSRFRRVDGRIEQRAGEVEGVY